MPAPQGNLKTVLPVKISIKERKSGSLTICHKKALKNVLFIGIFPTKGGGFRTPKLYVKFWWSLFLAIKLAFVFLKVPMGEGGHQLNKYS